MLNLLRNKRKIYLCNRVINEEINRIEFTEPLEYRVNYQPLSTDGEIIASGNDYIKRLAIYTSLDKAKDFHNFDRCYVFKNIPEEYDKNCTTADFYVDGEPLLYLNEAIIYLQRMIGDEDE